jgi:hypothetical protein
MQLAVQKVASMPMSRKLLCLSFAVIAVIALGTTWSQGATYIQMGSGAYAMFWTDTKATSGSRFITIDILILSVAVTMLMVVESRKHQIRFVWAYVAGCVIIGISIVFPIFLIARELRLSSAEPVKIHPVDMILLIIFGVASVGMAVWVAAG